MRKGNWLYLYRMDSKLILNIVQTFFKHPENPNRVNLEQLSS